MGLGDLFRKLVGGDGGDSGGERSGEPVEYNGYRIRPAPKSQNGQFLTAGYISKEFRVMACPQADFREQSPYNYGMKTYARRPAGGGWNWTAKGFPVTSLN